VVSTFLLARYKQADRLRVKRMTILPGGDPANLYSKCFGYEISTRITCRLSESKLDADYYIEGIEEGAKANERLWHTSWQLSPVAKETFIPNAIEVTLRPSAAGDKTNLPVLVGAATHWEAVDEATPDYDTSYVAEDDGTGGVITDLYNLENSDYTGGTINSVTVYALCRSSKVAATQGYGYTTMKTNAVEYNGTSTTLVGVAWFLLSKAYTLNPQTGVAWTWTEVQALQAGVTLYPPVTAGFADGDARCTQVYAVVNFTPGW